MLRRIFFNGAAWLALGAAISVFVAWGIAAWMPLRATSRRELTENAHGSWQWLLSINEYYGHGWTRRTWEFMIPGDDKVPWEFLITDGIDSSAPLERAPAGGASLSRCAS
jgi:hypothetical protein